MKYADRSRTSRPGARRKNFGGGSSRKSSRSIHSSRPNGTCRVPGRRVLGVVDDVHLLDLALGVVRDHHLERVEDAEPARRRPVQDVADRVLEQAELDDGVGLRDADHRREVADALGREAAPAQARDRRHPRVVPAADVALVDQPQQDALRQHGVGEVQARELVLARPRRHRQVLDQPVVERPVGLELERAERVGDALDRVRLAVGEVVGRVDAPGVARPRVRRVHDPVQHRIAQVDVRRGHVDPGPQHPRAVRELARAHPREQVEALVDRPVAPRRVAARLRQRAAVLADLVGRQVVDVGEAGPDEVDGPFVELLEVVGRVVEVVAPVEARASGRRPGSRRCTPAPP